MYKFFCCLAISFLSLNLAFANTDYMATPGKSLFLPINQTSDNSFALEIKIPRNYKVVTSSEKGYIPGILTFLVEDYDEQTQNFVFNGRFKRKFPQIIRVQNTQNKEISTEEFIKVIKAKMQKDLLVPPEFFEEYSQITKDYSMHSLGLILGYSGQAEVEVVYIRYYSGKKALCGIQVERTLAPTSSGVPAPLAKAKKELAALEKFVDKMSIVRRVKSQ